MSSTIKFDPVEHKYVDGDGRKYTSVTQLISSLTPEYDSEFWGVYRVLDKLRFKVIPFPNLRKIKINNSLYTINELLTDSYVHRVLGISSSLFNEKQEKDSVNLLKDESESVREEWKMFAEERSSIGNVIHDGFERVIRQSYGEDTEDLSIYNIGDNKFDKRMQSTHTVMDFKNIQINRFMRHLIQDGYKIFPEKILYLPEYLLSGKSDVPAINFKTKRVRVIDWKTNSHKIEFDAGYYKKVWNEARTEKLKTDEWISTNERFKYPLDSLPLSTGNGYTVQLSLYMNMIIKMLKETTGETFKADLCTIIHTNEHGVRIIPIDYLEKDVENLLQWRKSQISHGYSRRPIR